MLAMGWRVVWYEIGGRDKAVCAAQPNNQEGVLSRHRVKKGGKSAQTADPLPNLLLLFN